MKTLHLFGFGLLLAFTAPFMAQARSNSVVAFSEIDSDHRAPRQATHAVLPSPHDSSGQSAYLTKQAARRADEFRQRTRETFSGVDYRTPPAHYRSTYTPMAPDAPVLMPAPQPQLQPQLQPQPAPLYIQPDPGVTAAEPSPPPPTLGDPPAPPMIEEPPPAPLSQHTEPAPLPQQTAAAASIPGEYNPPKTLRVWAGGGYSNSSLNWNIGVGDIDILSELTWQDIHSARVEAGGEYYCGSGWCKNMMVFASIYGDSAYSGYNQDSDWNTSGRVDEFSRSINSIDGTKLRGFSAALGYDLAYDTPNMRLSLIPTAGYTYDTQELRMNHGYQVIPATGAFPGLNSTYDAEWDGPFAGLQTRILLFGQHELRAGASLHESDYSAAADWNLREEFAHPLSYEQFAKGSGHKFDAGYSYWFLPDWELRLNARFEKYKVGGGEDIVYLADGNSYSRTRFNEAKFKSHSYTAAIGYSF